MKPIKLLRSFNFSHFSHFRFLTPFDIMQPLHFIFKIHAAIVKILSLLITLSIFTIPLSSYAIKHEGNKLNASPSSQYAHYKLSLDASNHAPRIGHPVVFKAKIEPFLDDSKIEYQFLINGEPISEAGMHKVHIFHATGTYKVSVVATLGNSYLINSPIKLIHVSESWQQPIAGITPKTLTVKTGETAIFRSNSETDPKSRQWLYWSIDSGHRSNGNTFKINTSRLKEGQYPITLLLRDDQKKESTGKAMLIINNNTQTSAVNEVTPNVKEDITVKPTATDKRATTSIELTFRSSHIHRLTGMPIIYWVQNSQIGADTQLQLDTGDNIISAWGRRLRYSHIYKHTGIYQAQLSARSRANPTATQRQQQHTLTVYIWPLWLPLFILGSIVLFALVMLFKRRKKPSTADKATTISNISKTNKANKANNTSNTNEKNKRETNTTISGIRYKHYPDEGYQQITINVESEKKPASFSLSQQLDTGTQTLKTTKGE